MQWIVFAFLTALVALGVRRMAHDAHDAMRGEKDGSANAFTRTTPPPAARSGRAQVAAQDTVQCPVCQAYVVPAQTRCARAGCPYPRAPDADGGEAG